MPPTPNREKGGFIVLAGVIQVIIYYALVADKSESVSVLLQT